MRPRPVTADIKRFFNIDGVDLTKIEVGRDSLVPTSFQRIVTC
ncbi:hypothetical protein [Williamsia sp. DF01-3]|nr:hypothetical protein [Williamsia sp. DF01-3]